MRRLRGIDAGFLTLELPVQPMHTMSLALIRPACGPDGMPMPVTGDELRAHMAVRLHALPDFRARLRGVPMGLHHPVLYEDPEFELDRHLGHAELPAPGGSAELEGLYASLAGRCLERDKPLWRLTLVDGLEDGRQGLVLEMHHALMDGDATLATFRTIFAGAPSPEGQDAWHPERRPRRARLFLGAMADHVRGLRQVPGLLSRTRQGAKALKAWKATSSVSVPQPFRDVPLCSVSRGFTAERRFTRATLSLEDVRLVKETAGVTVNDVVLTVVGGALRAYLQARDELPERSLVAGVPVGGGAGEGGPTPSRNRFSLIMATLATDVADPWERLEAVSAVTRAAKAQIDLLGRDLLGDWVEYFPPFLSAAGVRKAQKDRVRHPERLDANVTVSNIRGPAEPWSFGSATVEEMYVTGPPKSGVGVSLVVWDYAGRLLLGILSFADSMDDPGELADRLNTSLRGLVAAAQERRPA